MTGLSKGGFLMQRFEHLPMAGDKFIDSGYEFCIARKHGRQVHTDMVSRSRKIRKDSDIEPVDGAKN
jgi:Mg2+/Co2+ transporter CorC